MAKKNMRRWDELMVIFVIVGAGLSILVLLASYVSVTGQAYASALTENSGIALLNDASVVQGDGRMVCDTGCARIGKICVVAHSGEELVSCSEPIRGGYECLCA